VFAKVNRGRHTARLEGDFVVFLIGMRVNRAWKLTKWLPVAAAMPRMLKWLEEHPEAGMLSFQRCWLNGGPAVVQYWRDFDSLERFARSSDAPHLAPWKQFNQAVRASGEVGIWHETYRVRAGEYECIYGNMPQVGLAAAGALAPVGSAGQSAARRVGARDEDEVAVPYYDNP
jgi:hypothetical protein